MEETMKAEAKAAPPESPKPAKQVKCPTCGRFAHLLPEANPHSLPCGYYCKTCNWHEKRKHFMANLLGNSLVDAIRMAPLNPILRTQAHAALLLPIPDDRKDFMDIKNWIEFEYQSPEPVDGSVISNGRPDIPSFEAVAIEILLDCSDNEFGNCSYFVERRGRGTYEVTTQKLLEMAQEVLSHGGGMRELLNDVTDWLHNEAIENPPAMNHVAGTMETTDRETSEDSPSDFSASLDSSRLNQQIKEFLFARFLTLYENLNLNDNP